MRVDAVARKRAHGLRGAVGQCVSQARARRAPLPSPPRPQRRHRPQRAARSLRPARLPARRPPQSRQRASQPRATRRRRAGGSPSRSSGWLPGLPRDMRAPRLLGRAPRKRARCSTPRADVWRSRSPRSGPSPMRTSRASGTSCERLQQHGQPFLPGQPPDEDKCVRLERHRQHRVHDRRRVDDHLDALRGDTPPCGDLREVSARDDDPRRSQQRRRSQLLQGADGGACGSLEPFERAHEAPVANRPLVRRVRDELHDERPPRDQRRRCRCGVGRRRVDDVRVSRQTSCFDRNSWVPHHERGASRDRVYRHGSLRRFCVRHRDHTHVVSAVAKETSKVGPVCRRPTDVGRPDACEENDAHRRSPGRQRIVGRCPTDPRSGSCTRSRG